VHQIEAWAARWQNQSGSPAAELADKERETAGQNRKNKTDEVAMRDQQKQQYYSFRVFLKRNPVARKAYVALYALTSEGAISLKELSRVLGEDYSAVRRAVRTLARRGLAELHRALWTDDGRPAGSGYALTEKGEQMMDGVLDIVDEEMSSLYPRLKLYA